MEKKTNSQSLHELCSICTEYKPKSEFFSMNSCTHSFCIVCVTKHITTKIQEPVSSTPILCPDVNCKNSIINPENWKPLVPETALQSGSKKFYCPFKDCSELIKEDIQNVVGSAICSFCRRLFCVQCKAGWHQGLDCEAYRKNVAHLEAVTNEALTMKLVKDMQWQKCPGCGYYIELVRGCLHITCSCSCQFCYRCGKKWELIHDCV